MNIFVMFGKVLEVVKDDNPSKCLLVLENQKDYRENDGDYHTQIFQVRIWRGLHDKLLEENLIGNNVLLKGRIETENKKPILITESMKIIQK